MYIFFILNFWIEIVEDFTKNLAAREKMFEFFYRAQDRMHSENIQKYQ